MPQRHLHGLPRHASDGDELNPPRKEPSIERLRQGVARLHAVPCGA